MMEADAAAWLLAQDFVCGGQTDPTGPLFPRHRDVAINLKREPASPRCRSACGDAMVSILDDLASMMAALVCCRKPPHRDNLAIRKYIARALVETADHGKTSVALIAIVALLYLKYMDEQFNNAQYSRAVISMVGKINRSFGC